MPTVAIIKKQSKTHSDIERLVTVYLTVLAVIALLTLAGQFVSQTAQRRANMDSQWLAAASRQEVLASRLALTALAVQMAETPDMRAVKAAELRVIVDQWQQNQRDLERSDMNRRMDAVAPLQQAMLGEAQGILAALPPDGSARKPELYVFLTPLLQNEAQFLPALESVAHGYALDARQQEASWRQTSRILLVLTLLTLASAVALVFGPIGWLVPRTLRAMREQAARTRDQNAALGEADRQLAEMRDVLENLSTVDALTGLKNHRAFHERLDSEMGRALRHGHSLSLLLLDVDLFKSFNDAYGHPHGDEALKMVGSALAENARTSDIPARYGGEEFAMILTETDTMGSVILGERLRQSIAAADCLQRPITTSIGIATLTPGISGAAELIAQADRALCHAKGEGRNRVSHVSRLPTITEENWRFLPERDAIAA